MTGARSARNKTGLDATSRSNSPRRRTKSARDVSKAHRVARALRAGTVWVNCYNVFDSTAPFGGYKESGYGRELGRYALDLYTQVKSVWMQI